jgi:lipoate-protein ligase B
VLVEWRGLWAFEEALSAQRQWREAVIRGSSPGALWFLEHPPVITVGRRDARVNTELIEAAGYALVATERGGLATCHEPGQLVGYLIRDVSRIGVRCSVHAIEAALISWLSGEGVEARRRPDAPGVWVGGDKIAALGLHVRRGVTMHGFAINLTNNMLGFTLITPCGVVDGGVTSLQRCRGNGPTPEQAWRGVGRAVALAFESLDSCGGRG